MALRFSQVICIITVAMIGCTQTDSIETDEIAIAAGGKGL